MVLMAVVVLAVASSATAASKTWNVDAAGDWVTPANWTPAAAPVSGDNLILGNIITAPRILTLGTNYTLYSLAVNNTNAGSLYTLSSTAVRTVTMNGTGTIISTGALGANLGLSASPTFVTYVLPNTAGLIWDFAGPTYIGTVNGTSPLATLTKTGAGMLTYGGSGSYSGTLTLNGGNFRLTGSPTAMGNFLMTPTIAGDMTFDGTGVLGLAAGKTARFLGTGSGNVIISPGTTASATTLLKIGTAGGTTSTVTMDNLSRYNANVSGTAPVVSDTLGVLGTLNLGATGTTNSLYITRAPGSLQSAYILAGASTALNGKFNQVYDNGVLVVNPETAGAFGGTHQIVYGAKSVMLVNPTTNRKTYWVNPDTTTNAVNYWDVGGNWSGGTKPTSADNVFISYSTAFLAGNNNSRTVGSFRADGLGTISLGNNWTITTKSDNGANGDFFWTDLTNKPVGNGHTINVDGNLWIGQLYFQTNGYVDTFNLYGTNKYVLVNAYDEWSGSQGDANVQNIYGSYYENSTIAAPDRQNYYQQRNTVTVKVGGRIITNPDLTKATRWVARTYIFEGGQSNLPNVGDCVTFMYQPAQNDNGSNRLVIAGGVTYPQDVIMGADYWAITPPPKGEFTWRIKGGDVGVGRDLQIRETSGNSALDAFVLSVEENGTLAKRNLTVGRDLIIGTVSSLTEAYGIRMKNATIRVGRNVLIGATTNTYLGVHQIINRNLMDFGNATISVGGNWTVYAPTQFTKTNWNPGTSTAIFDGNNKVGITQTLYTWGDNGLYFNNLTVRTKGGTVALSNVANENGWPGTQVGNTGLTGNLLVDNGTFNLNGRKVTFYGKGKGLTLSSPGIMDGRTAGSGLVFQGGGSDCATAQLITVPAGWADNTLGTLQIRTGSPTFVQLLSDIRVTGLTIDNGCALVLNGHTIKIGYPTTPTAIDYTTSYNQGMIYATWGDVAPIPEPGTMLLIGTGAVGLIGWMRRRRMK
jgi:hypothetical protein